MNTVLRFRIQVPSSGKIMVRLIQHWVELSFSDSYFFRNDSRNAISKIVGNSNGSLLLPKVFLPMQILQVERTAKSSTKSSLYSEFPITLLL